MACRMSAGTVVWPLAVMVDSVINDPYITEIVMQLSAVGPPGSIRGFYLPRGLSATGHLCPQSSLRERAAALSVGTKVTGAVAAPAAPAACGVSLRPPSSRIFKYPGTQLANWVGQVNHFFTFSIDGLRAASNSAF